MALNLIYGRKYAQSSVGIVSFDTMVTEEHKFSSRVTHYPVESGTIVSDHIINQPDMIILSGLISDTPLNLLAPFNRSVAAFNTLIQLHRQRQVVQVVTGLRVYQQMAIVSLDIPRTMKTGQTLTFNIQLQSIIYDNGIQTLVDGQNVFSGITDNTPRAIVAENTNIPILQNDPRYSLKDQASSAVSVGVQGLEAIPTAVLPNVLSNLTQIYGIVNANNTI